VRVKSVRHEQSMEDSSDPSRMLVVVTVGLPISPTVIVTVPMIMVRCRAMLIVRVVRCHGRNCPVNCW
jgi:hypothetical protein